MTYTLTIHPDGTYVSLHHDDGVIDREELAATVGGRLYIDALAQDADIVTSETANGRGTTNTSATAVAWAFGKTQLAYYGDVIVTGGADKRGHLHGLRQQQVDALTDALALLRHRRESGLPVQLLDSDTYALLRDFKTSNLDTVGEPDEEDEQKPKAGLIYVLCVVAGLILGGGLTWIFTSGQEDEDTDVVVEEPEPGAEDEAGVTVEELNNQADELTQRESDIEDYEESMQDLDVRESDLDTRSDDLDSRESDVETRESTVEDREDDAETLEGDLDERESSLDDREDELDERESSIENQPQPPEQSEPDTEDTEA